MCWGHGEHWCTKSHLPAIELLRLEKTYGIVNCKQNKADLILQHEFSITGFQEFSNYWSITSSCAEGMEKLPRMDES